MDTPPPRIPRAVVIGGSVAGLLTARVLADHAEHVVVCERDVYSDAVTARPGVPQANHIHALLTRGRRVLESLFPGFSAELARSGAISIDYCNDRLKLMPYGWQPRFRSDLSALLTSRTFLEDLIRRSVSELPNITLRTGVRAESLSANGGTVTGVSLSRRGHEDEPDELLSADLVVDAAGRASNAPDWLDELGFGELEETVIDARWGYASRFYAMPQPWPYDFKLLNMWPMANRTDSQRTRGAALSQQDNGRCIVTLIGNCGDFPPKDEAGFADFARSLAAPYVADIVDSAEPLGPISVSRSTANRFRHFERLPRHPERFLAIGDSVAAFNPVYGQGMSASAMSAEQLGVELGAWLAAHDGGLDGFGQHMQALVVESVQFPWSASVGGDSRLAECKGALPQDEERNAYLARVTALTGQDPGLILKAEQMGNLLRGNEWMVEDSVRQRVTEQWDELGAQVGAPPRPAPVRERAPVAR